MSEHAMVWLALGMAVAWLVWFAVEWAWGWIRRPCDDLPDDHWRHLWHDHGEDYTHLYCLNCQRWREKNG